MMTLVLTVVLCSGLGQESLSSAASLGTVDDLLEQATGRSAGRHHIRPLMDHSCHSIRLWGLLLSMSGLGASA